MADAQLQKNVEHQDAVEGLIKKLCLDPTLVGDATSKRDNYSFLGAQFWIELDQFWNRTGRFNHEHIWPVAENLSGQCRPS